MNAKIPLVSILVLGTNFSAFAASPPDPNSFDIIGIKPGMSIAQVEAVLHAHDPQMTIDNLTGPNYEGNNVTVFIHAFKAVPNPQEPGLNSILENIAVTFTQTLPQRVEVISRDLLLSPGQRPLTQNLLNQIIAKYGPYSDLWEGYIWTFNANGQLMNYSGQTMGPDGQFHGSSVNNALVPSVCEYQRQIVPVEYEGIGSYSPAPRFQLTYYTQFNPACGTTFVAQIGGDGTGLTAELSETLASTQIAIADIQSQTAYQQAQQAKQNAKASGNSPNL